MNFETACHLSGMDRKDPRAAIGLLGQLANSGLGPGTADTYVGYINKKYRMTDIMKAASARHADHESKHAPDIADDVLWRYVEESDFVWQPLLYTLYVLGLRPRAARFLRRRRLLESVHVLRVSCKLFFQKKKNEEDFFHQNFYHFFF